MDFFIKPVYATCPVCVITVGGGLLIAKKLGIDDLLVSIWLSGLNTALAFWIASTVKKKIVNNPFLWSFGFYTITIVYLWYSKQLWHPQNTLFGVDKILLGMTAGLLVFLCSVLMDKLIRYNNKGKVLFYYQKVVIPVVFLLLITVIARRFI